MKNGLIILVSMWFCCEALAQETAYRRVKIDVSGYGALAKLALSGIAIDHGIREKSSLVAELRSEEISELEKLNIPYQVLINDLAQFYEARALLEKDLPQMRLPNSPAHFRLGSMGGFLTLAEIYQAVDSMRLLYPNLISIKDSIGGTIQGRPIYAVKIGSALSVGKSQVLYTAMHHCREPNGMMALVYYMWWLLENYASNTEAKYLVDNREMWFIPVVNPDGYEYNRTTNPNGGGMWRKNRRPNADQTFGVDLNRNYGKFEFWNAPNGGSSTTPSSDTYRGTGPFSEPETQSLRAFCNRKQFKAVLNYHTFSNLLIYPFGYAEQETPDSLIFRRFAKDMTATNGYVFGTDQQTVGYSTRGNSDDWMYGEQKEKPKSFALTPEVGAASDGFWPQPSRITPLCAENLEANKYLAWIAGGYITAEQTNDLFLSIGQPTTLSFQFFNKGLENVPSATVALSSANPNVQLSNTVALNALASQAETNGTFTVQLSNGVEIGTSIDLTLTINQENVERKQTFSFIAGAPQTAFIDSAESAPLWSGGTWAKTTAQFFSGNFSWTDSPNGDYAANSRNFTLLQPVINLVDTAIKKAYLSYQAKWIEIEPTWDWCQVYISTNNGANWQALRGPRMKAGSGQGVQALNQYGYEGTELNWTKETIDISAYKGFAQIRFRFGLLSDASAQGDGFYFDDVKIEILTAGRSSISETALVPRQVGLKQNYPNPFNPTTTIEYQLVAQSEVQLVLYDVLGRQIATLVNERQESGRYRVQLSSGNYQLSSGVYFYRLQAGSFSETRKMILMK